MSEDGGPTGVRRPSSGLSDPPAQAGVSLAGLGVLIARSAAIFAALRYAGAVYLAWCG